MSKSSATRRARGGIETLPSGSLRVRVFAGYDPLTKRRNYLKEVVPAGPRAEKEAERVRTRLLNQVDGQRNPRTSATVNQLIDRYLEVLDVEEKTRRGYIAYIDTHVRPQLSPLQVGKVDAEVLDAFYASLRTCRDNRGQMPVPRQPELEALKEAARQRMVAGQTRLDLGLDWRMRFCDGSSPSSSARARTRDNSVSTGTGRPFLVIVGALMPHPRPRAGRRWCRT